MHFLIDKSFAFVKESVLLDRLPKKGKMCQVKNSLTGQTLIIGAKESGESHAKVMFHRNA